MVSPSAPALTQARAISTMSVTSGLSLAKMGMSRGSFSRTSAMTLADDSGSQAKTSPRFATLGQEMLTSTPTTASNAGDWRRTAATPAYSPAVFPAMDASTRAPTDLSHTRSLLGKVGDPRSLQADRVEHPARRLGHPGGAAAGSGIRQHRLGDEGTQLGDVEEAVQLLAVRRAARSGHQRVGQGHPGQVDAHVDGGCRGVRGHRGARGHLSHQ